MGVNYSMIHASELSPFVQQRVQFEWRPVSGHWVLYVKARYNNRFKHAPPCPPAKGVRWDGPDDEGDDEDGDPSSFKRGRSRDRSQADNDWNLAY